MIRVRVNRPRVAGPVLAGLTLALMAACSNAPPGEASVGAETFGAVRGLMPQLRSGGDGPESPGRLRPTPGFPGLEPAVIARHQQGALMGGYLESRDAMAVLVLAATNRDTQTWFTADQVSLSMSGGGMLVSTRGLGPDLQAANVSQSAALIAAGRSGSAQRRHVYIDGVLSRYDRVFSCDVQQTGTQTLVLNARSYRTLTFDENCRGDGIQFTNRYWRDAAGPTIRQSTQWIGPELGVVHLQRLID
jgi:hypothetical protein